MNLDDVHEIVSGHMDEILGCFKPGRRITVLVRNPERPTEDFMMTRDDPAEAIKMIERRTNVMASPDMYEALEMINKAASPNPTRTFDQASRDLELITDYARAALARARGDEA